MHESGMSLERCKRNIILLSLDITMPAYKHMGLNFPEGKKVDFVEVLRNIIRGMGGASVYIPIPPTLIQNVLQGIEARLGRQARDHYLDWAVYIYEEAPADHPHTQAWSSILTWCAARPTRWALLDLPKSISKQSRRDLIISAECLDIEELFAQSTAEHLSQWDSNILDERKFEDGPWSPGLAVESNVFRYRFRCALKRLVNVLSKEEVDLFWKSVQAVGLENDLTIIDDLRGPKDLREPAYVYGYGDIHK